MDIVTLVVILLREAFPDWKSMGVCVSKNGLSMRVSPA